MSGHSEACRANARQCLEIATKTRALDDSSEFLSFAETWERLAKEIESNERLVALIEGLASNLAAEGQGQQMDDLSDSDQAIPRSLRRLTSAIVAATSHFVADHFARSAEEADNMIRG
jgi:hypothetical protein